MTFDNRNRGAIWGNDKEGNPRRPDFKGSLNVSIEPSPGESLEEFAARLKNGLEFWVSAWKRKEDANPKAPALSFNIELKDDKYQNSNSPAGDIDYDDDIPF